MCMPDHFYCNFRSHLYPFIFTHTHTHTHTHSRARASELGALREKGNATRKMPVTSRKSRRPHSNTLTHGDNQQQKRINITQPTEPRNSNGLFHWSSAAPVQLGVGKLFSARGPHQSHCQAQSTWPAGRMYSTYWEGGGRSCFLLVRCSTGAVPGRGNLAVDLKISWETRFFFCVFLGTNSLQVTTSRAWGCVSV